MRSDPGAVSRGGVEEGVGKRATKVVDVGKAVKLIRVSEQTGLLALEERIEKAKTEVRLIGRSRTVVVRSPDRNPAKAALALRRAEHLVKLGA